MGEFNISGCLVHCTFKERKTVFLCDAIAGNEGLAKVACLLHLKAKYCSAKIYFSEGKRDFRDR